MIYFAYFLIVFSFIRLIVILLNVFTRPWLRKSHQEVDSQVSVMIPARNEAENIGSILDDLIKSEPTNLIREILVYDDLSTDETGQIVSKYSRDDSRIRLIRGKELPAGWRGKNHACYQLASNADNEWMVFIDADVRISPNAILQAVSMASQKRLALLSVFPYQQMKTNGEKVVVPIMNWILLSLLPLFLVRTCKWISFSAANGQFMLFHSEAYRKYQWHERVKNDPVEDILISREVKKKKLKTATLIGRGEISCRMYSGYSDAMEGFTKNFGQFFGNNIPWMFLFLILSSIGIIVVPLYLTVPWSIVYGAILFAMRIGVAAITRQSTHETISNSIAQQMVMWVLAFKSLRYRFGKKLIWKGREI